MMTAASRSGSHFARERGGAAGGTGAAGSGAGAGAGDGEDGSVMETEAGAARSPVKASYQRSGSVDHQRQSVLRFLAEPGHVNFGGKVHGGAVMKWVDQAGYTCAAGWSGRYCVTVYVGGIHFTHPIQVGNVVELQATVIHTGRSSMHIMVDIYAGDPKGTGPRQGRCGAPG